MNTIAIQRAYTSKEADGTYRVLIDRLWPRGIRKVDLALDEWDKEIAPSSDLRKWFGHEAARFEAFAELYRKELADKNEAVQHLVQIARQQDLTLLYGAKDLQINHAVVLKTFLMETK